MLSTGRFGVALFLRGFSVERTRDLRGRRTTGIKCVLGIRLTSSQKVPCGVVSSPEKRKSDAMAAIGGMSEVGDPNLRRGS